DGFGPKDLLCLDPGQVFEQHALSRREERAEQRADHFSPAPPPAAARNRRIRAARLGTRTFAKNRPLTKRTGIESPQRRAISSSESTSTTSQRCASPSSSRSTSARISSHR